MRLRTNWATTRSRWWWRKRWPPPAIINEIGISLKQLSSARENAKLLDLFMFVYMLTPLKYRCLRGTKSTWTRGEKKMGNQLSWTEITGKWVVFLAPLSTISVVVFMFFKWSCAFFFGCASWHFRIVRTKLIYREETIGSSLSAIKMELFNLKLAG